MAKGKVVAPEETPVVDAQAEEEVEFTQEESEAVAEEAPIEATPVVESHPGHPSRDFHTAL